MSLNMPLYMESPNSMTMVVTHISAASILGCGWREPYCRRSYCAVDFAMALLCCIALLSSLAEAVNAGSEKGHPLPRVSGHRSAPPYTMSCINVLAARQTVGDTFKP